MKMLIILLLFLPVGLLSHNWQLINPNNVCFYKTNGSELINNTVMVDSVIYGNNDTVLFLNTVITPCDTCKDYSIPCDNPYPHSNDPKYQLIQPNFLQKKIQILPGGKWYFQDTAYFVILPFARLSDIWLFDTANNISAEITEKTYAEVFPAVFDSVKTITLSNNREIRLSKNFGIIEFPDLFGDNAPAILAGVEGDTVAGASLYKFKDYFNFNIGDVFQYYREHWWVDWNDVNFRESFIKYKIISKKISGDTLKYGISGIIKEDDYPGYRYEDTLVFIDSANHITNQYLNTLFDYTVDCRWCISRGDTYKTKLLYSNYGFTLLDTTSLVNFLPGQNPLIANLFFPCDEYPGFLGSPDENNQRTYTLGFGLSVFRVEGFEWATDSLIIGYVRNGDTVGTVYDDDVLLFQELFPEEKNTRVNTYPNPAKSVLNIYVKGNMKNQPFEVILLNLQGQVVFQKKFMHNRRLFKINTLSFQNGFYLMEIKFPDHIETHKVVIQHP